MELQLWFLSLCTFVQIVLGSPSHKSSIQNGQGQPVVYTAESARQFQVDPTQKSKTVEENTENAGFVEPIDFNSFFSQVARADSKRAKGAELNPFTSESKNKESFPDFFRGSGSSNSYSSDPFASLSSSPSNTNARKPEDDSEDGFVDPSVQFRSLFDSSETAGGFSPSDFLGNKNENVGHENSKASQTRSYPSFTYTGRVDGNSNNDEEYGASPESNPKYRSSYRQVDGRRTDDPYDDSNYYNGEHDDSPPPPPPPPRQYRVQNNNDDSYGNDDSNSKKESSYGPSSQESAHAPTSTGGKPKGVQESNAGGGGGGKNKCKKVEKLVDEDDDYNEYSESPSDYDPSTYSSRYKRQAGGRGGGGGNKKNKRPMTCYVCEDEQGRYAERCSYDSNQDPKKGTYFHSSSTSFSDNGKPKGSRERHRRNNSPASLKVSASTLSPKSELLPKKIEKRQSQGNRYASNYRDRNQQNHENNDEDEAVNYNGPLEEHYDDYVRPNERRNRDRTQNNYGEFEFSPPTRSNGRNNGRRSNSNDRDFEFGPPADFGHDEGEKSSGFEGDFQIPKEFETGRQGTSHTNNRPIFSSQGFGRGGREGGGDFDIGYDDYVKQYFPESLGSANGGGGPSVSPSQSPSGRREESPQHSPSSYSPHKESSHHPINYSPPSYYGPEESPEVLQKAISNFNQKDRRDCERVQKGEMSCYVCRDPRGMQEEECMYESKDPKNKQMSYHQVSEYSSLPPASILPLPQQHGKIGAQESKVVVEVKKAPLDYDFDY